MVFDFIFPSGRMGWLNGVRGTVVGHKKWSETHVSSSGGGGYMPQGGGGYVSAPRISGRVETKSEFWIRTSDNTDVKIEADIEIMEGHTVSILWGDSQKGQDGHYLYWHNETSKKSGYFPGNFSSEMLVSVEEKNNARRKRIIMNIVIFLVIFVIDFKFTYSYLTPKSYGFRQSPDLGDVGWITLVESTISWLIFRSLFLNRPLMFISPLAPKRAKLAFELEEFCAVNRSKISGS